MIVARFIACGGGPGSLLDLGCVPVLRVAKRRRSTCGTSSLEWSDVDDHVTSGHPFQQELFNLRAQVAVESGLPMKCELPTISRHVKFERTLRVLLT